MIITKRDVPLVLNTLLAALFKGRTDIALEAARCFPNSYASGDKLFVVDLDKQHIATICVKAARCKRKIQSSLS